MMPITFSIPLETPIVQHENAIQNARLALERIEKRMDHLSISFFFNEPMEPAQSVDFYLHPIKIIPESSLSSLYAQMQATKTYTVADVYPLNGTSKNRRFKMTDFMKPHHREELQKQLNLLDKMDPEKKIVRCLVIDFKDVLGGYNHKNDIAGTEKAFTHFFIEEGATKVNEQLTIHQLIKSNNIHFFINEGSLKADLITKAFTAGQGQFLQNNERGQELFCQLCEVIMNGFKQGFETNIKDHRFCPNDYINILNERSIRNSDDAGPCLPVVPHLLTFYPDYYKNMYAEKGEYYQLITKIFKASHSYENPTTIISIE